MIDPGSSSQPDPPPTALAASATSGHLDTRTAATEIAHSLHDALGSTCDLLLLFGSFHHAAAFADAGTILRNTLTPTATLGVTAESVVGGPADLEGQAGLTAMGLRLPGVALRTWMSTPQDPIRISRPETIPERIGLNDEFRAAIMFADPFSTPITRLLPALTDARPGGPPIPIVGGMASGSSQPGHNVLLVDDHALSSGAIGVSISGNAQLEYVVSQGCRPIGRSWLVTKVDGNVILELGGTPALDALREMSDGLPEEERSLIGNGMLIGTAISEYRDHFGRGDFLVRAVLTLDERRRGIAVGDFPRVGQTVQIHVRDAETAHEDLQLLLDVQQLDEPPLAGLLVTCNGRGKRLFGEPGHDQQTIRRQLGDLPMAGMFAAGEIGPIGDRSYLHGHTASLTLIRARRLVTQ